MIWDLKGVYSKPTAPQLLEGNGDKVGYLSGINALTIDDSQRLRDEYDGLKDKLLDM